MAELTITPIAACEQLRYAGFNIGYDKFRFGLQQGVFPFGVALRVAKGYEYIVYRHDLTEFIRAHGGTVDGEGEPL